MKELEIHDRVGGVASFCCKSSSIHDLGTIWEEGRDEEGKHLEKMEYQVNFYHVETEK